MTRLFTDLSLAICLFVGAGCTRTYISTQKPEQTSPDGITRLGLVGHGAYGRSYVDRTRKLLDVVVLREAGTKEVTLFLHRYTFVAADMGWHVHWASPAEAIIDVFDDSAGSNHIATLRLAADQRTGKFVEKR
jgi:hypothetical protein